MIEINIQMPEKCGLCPCFHHGNPMYCQAVKADKNKKIVSPYGSPRPEWCPLKEQEPVEAPLDAFGHPYCPKCKVLVYQTWHYCPHCGKAVQCNERPV